MDNHATSSSRNRDSVQRGHTPGYIVISVGLYNVIPGSRYRRALARFGWCDINGLHSEHPVHNMNMLCGSVFLLSVAMAGADGPAFFVGMGHVRY